jgi:DNA modification methylase
MSINKLILGDNLEVLKTVSSDSIDLIYLDPPFFSNRNYEVIWGDEGEIRSFQDRWAGGIDHYIAWLKERVEQMYRVLKPTGSFFLHCDWHADAYIRVEILDKIFGRNNFRNEIIWCYKKWAVADKCFSKNHDNILFYTKSGTYTYNQLLQDRAESTFKRFGNKKIVSGFSDEGSRIPSTTKEEESGGVKMYDWWDIPIIPPSGHERIGYPTQKPMALLERIIKCASNEGDIILDPFMGGGTTIAVADKLNRSWIGIDQSVQAVKVTELRLQQQTDLFTGLYTNSYTLQLYKYDYDMLRYQNAFEFESWIVGQFGGISNAKQRNDFGLDGKMPDNTPIQVKRTENVGRNVIDNFFAAIQRSDKKLFDKNVERSKPAGYIIAFSFGRGAVEEVARLKNKENILIKLVTIDEIIPVAKKPAINIDINELSRNADGMREIEFTATGQSKAGIEFYSWDFDYQTDKGFKPSVIMDKEGKQKRRFNAGFYTIAVKVVDNDGLESIEEIKLKVNGIVELQ